MGLMFTPREIAYLNGQRLGRLATVDTTGVPQNNPVGFAVDAATGQLVIGGTMLGDTRKLRNIEASGVAAFVVDDLASTDPWEARGIEIRGDAEALRDIEPLQAGLSRELIRITPRWIGSWGIEPVDGLSARS